MKIFLAGGISGNLRDFWNKVMKIYEAAHSSRDEIIEAMKVFIAGDNEKKQILTDKLESYEMISSDDALKSINILESYYYLRNNEDFMKLVQYFGSFLLDSVVGLAEVERLRYKLETLTGKKPIPVWHKNRGKEYFIRMCEEYPYVAIGGIVTKEIPRKIYKKAFPWFIKTAHEHKCKIHGLGYTTIANLKKYHFDSVDSTAWLHGNRGGYLYKFNPKTGLMEKMSKDSCRLKSREGDVNNFNEWVKFGKYAEKFL